VHCVSESGSSVDWWFIYKQPNGLSYAYLDSSSRSSSLTIASSTLSEASGALQDTLSQVYSGSKSLAYAAWNDEPPKGATNDDAHAKGVLASNGKTGFWLLHSVPAFPDLSLSKYDWNASTIYGQSMLCISLSATQVDNIAELLQYADLGIYDKNMPSSIASDVPEFSKLVSGTTTDGAGTKVFKSVGGQEFTAFSKSESWGKNLYEELVSPTLKQSFMWETWRRSPALPTFCKGSDYEYDEININEIDFTAGGGAKYSYTKDHSKWGISEKASEPWVCIGDINRMSSQKARGGGTICFNHKTLYTALANVVSAHDDCSSSSATPTTIDMGPDSMVV